MVLKHRDGGWQLRRCCTLQVFARWCCRNFPEEVPVDPLCMSPEVRNHLQFTAMTNKLRCLA
jgi:hypothetical protein